MVQEEILFIIHFGKDHRVVSYIILWKKQVMQLLILIRKFQGVQLEEINL